MWMFVVCLGAGIVPCPDVVGAEASPACETNGDCACGWNPTAAACEVGSSGQVDTEREDCLEYCTGVDGTLEAVCRGGTCTRTRRSPCPGDCDGDVAVTGAEVVSGVSIALGCRSLATCRAFDANGNGRVTVDEILGATVARQSGCAAAIASPTGTALYDTHISFDSLTAVDTLGQTSTVAGVTTLAIEVGPNDSLSLRAVERTDGGFDLTGIRIITDIAYRVHGTATRTATADEERIEGVLQPQSQVVAPFQSATFVMRRDAMTTARFGGTYHLDLTASPADAGQPSSVQLGLDVAPSGVGVLSGGADTAPGGALLGTITSGRCLLAPGGGLSCNALYLVQASNVSASIRFTGKLTETAGAVSGNGRYLAGADPPHDLYVPGGWTAARLQP